MYGGGNAAPVEGSTTVKIWGKSKLFGNVYGGGNAAKVSGNTKVIVNGVTTNSK